LPSLPVTVTMRDMSIEYRPIKDSDFEAVASLEAVAFYSRPNPENSKYMRENFRPEWTVAAFDDGKPIAAVRTLPSMRLMHGTKTPFALISPVTCQAAYRRQGHVAKLLRQSLALMKERGQPISGLYTPHDALYRRYGWERAEEKRVLNFDPGRIEFRTPAPPGTMRSTAGTSTRSTERWCASRIGGDSSS